jgi:hypothetical protein
MQTPTMIIASTHQGPTGRACVLAAIEARGPFARVEWDAVCGPDRVQHGLPSRGEAEKLSIGWANDPLTITDGCAGELQGLLELNRSSAKPKGGA